MLPSLFADVKARDVGDIVTISRTAGVKVVLTIQGNNPRGGATIEGTMRAYAEMLVRAFRAGH